MKIAVTGATGHLGNVLVRDLLKEGHVVKVLEHADKRSSENSRVTVVNGGVNDTAAVAELVKGCDTVIHGAAVISINGDPYGMIRKVNVEGVENMLDAAVRYDVKKFIHVSSIHAYNQHPSHEPLDERRSYVGADAASYDQSKRDGQLLVLKYAGNGLNATIVNPTSMVGPPDHRPSLMGKAIIDLCNGKIRALIPGGFDFADVRDVSKGVIGAMHYGQKGESYLLSGKYFEITHIAKILSDLAGKKINPPVIPEWMARTALPFMKAYAAFTGTTALYTRESIDALICGNRKIDSSRASLELGFTVRPFEKTLQDTYHWFNENGFIKK